MHYYILDQNSQPMEKFEKLQTELSGLLAEFKVAGEASRVTPLRSVQELVDTASQRGAKTLVACGSDDTFNQMLAALKGRDFTLGFIPFDENSNLAKILGIDSVFTGVKTIAGRRIEKIDLAKIAGNYFISYLEFGVMSQNIRSGSAKNEKIANPTDGNLDLLILERLGKMQIIKYREAIADGALEKVPNTTVIKCKKIEFLEPRGFNLTMLGRVVAKFPSTVEIIPARLKMIVGKNRTF